MTLGSVMTRAYGSHSVGKPVTEDRLGQNPCARDLFVDARKSVGVQAAGHEYDWNIA
jgi:hypothetical protein